MSIRSKTRRKVKAKANDALVKRKKHPKAEFVDTWKHDWIVIGVRHHNLMESLGETDPENYRKWVTSRAGYNLVNVARSSGFPQFIVWNRRERYAVGLMSKAQLLEFIRKRRGKHWALYCFHSVVKRALRMTTEQIKAAIADNCAGPDATHLPLHVLVENLYFNPDTMNIDPQAIEAAELLVSRHFDHPCLTT